MSGDTIYTDYVEQRRLADAFFAIAYQIMVGKAFIEWLDQVQVHGR